MENEKKVVMGLALILMISLASAFGVSSFYWDGNPVRLYPGETAIVNLVLQNEVGVENYTFRAQLVDDGKGIASLADESPIYFVPANTHELNVPIKITIPSDVSYGEIRDIFVSFTQISDSTGGMISIAGAVGSKFPVEIVAKEKSTFYQPSAEVQVKKINNTLIYSIILLAVLLIVWLIVKKKK